MSHLHCYCHERRSEILLRMQPLAGGAGPRGSILWKQAPPRPYLPCLYPGWLGAAEAGCPPLLGYHSLLLLSKALMNFLESKC